MFFRQAEASVTDYGDMLYATVHLSAMSSQACVDACSLKALTFSRDVPETEEAYEVNLRTSIHYARASFPVDDAGIQPPMEALAAAGLPQVGAAGSAWAATTVDEEDVLAASGKEM